MLPVKSNGTASNYGTVLLDFTGNIKVSNLQIKDRIFVLQHWMAQILMLSTNIAAVKLNALLTLFSHQQASTLACSKLSKGKKTNFYAKIIILSPCLLIQLFDLPMLRRPRSLKMDKLQGCLSIGKSNICINKHGLKMNIFS